MHKVASNKSLIALDAATGNVNRKRAVDFDNQNQSQI
jgi:hypothetical protein